MVHPDADTSCQDPQVTRERSAVEHALATAWGLDDVTISAHEGGMNSRTWLVTAAGKRCVAKAVPLAERERLAAGLAVAAMVEASGIPAGAPMPTRDGGTVVELSGQALALLTFVDGAGLAGNGASEQRLIGETLARAHRALRGREVAGAQRFHWIDAGADHLALRRWLQPAVRAALDSWDSLPPSSLTWGLLHTDPAPEAFLLQPETGVCGLIDWDRGLIGPLMYDLASAVMYVGGPGRATQLVDAYLEHGALGRDEVERTLEPMLRMRWAVQADYFARRIVTGDLTGIDDAGENEEGLEDARRGLDARAT